MKYITYIFEPMLWEIIINLPLLFLWLLNMEVEELETKPLKALRSGIIFVEISVWNASQQYDSLIKRDIYNYN